MYENPNSDSQAMYNLGWENAINMVISVVDEMMHKGDFDWSTLEELGQRIV
jgi:hypothetical protein